MKTLKQTTLLLTGLLLLTLTSCKKTDLAPVEKASIADDGQSALTKPTERMLKNTNLVEFDIYLILSANYSYNSSFKLKSILLNPDFLNNTYGETWDYKYDENSMLRKVKDTDPFGADWGFWGLGYNNDNTVGVVELNYGSQSVAPLYRIFKYDYAGNISKVTDYRDSIPLIQWKYTYDVNGNLTSLANYYPVQQDGKINKNYMPANKETGMMKKINEIEKKRSLKNKLSDKPTQIAFNDLKYNWVLSYKETVAGKTNIKNPLAQQDRVFFYTTQYFGWPELHAYLLKTLPTMIRIDIYDGVSSDPFYSYEDDYTYTLDAWQYPLTIRETYKDLTYGGEADNYEWNFNYVK